MPKTNGSLSGACENQVPAPARAPQALILDSKSMLAGQPGVNRTNRKVAVLSGRLVLLLADQLARKPILQRVRQVEAGQLPGPIDKRQTDAELAGDRKIDRNRHAEFADAVIGGEVKLQRGADRLQIQP